MEKKKTQWHMYLLLKVKGVIFAETVCTEKRLIAIYIYTALVVSAHNLL